LFLPTLVAGLLLVAVTLAADTGAKGDLDALQGAWSLVSVEIDGEPLAMEMLKDARLVVKAEKYSFTLGDARLELRPKLYPDKKPKAIDLTVLDGSQKGQTLRGIYKLEGNTYTVCRNVEPGKERPTEFATKRDSGLMLVVWKRDKP
jgi:uncharacterized protein (TIGR03067 family)